MSLIKKLAYYDYFKRHLYFYWTYPLNLISRVFLKNRLMLVEISFESQCNFKCWHCSSSEFLNKNIRLSLDQLKGVIKKLKAAGAISIAYVGGEPILRKDLCDIVRLTNENWILPSIITNAFLLTEEKTDELFRSGLAFMGFSLQSMSPDVHDGWVNQRGAHAKVLKSIEYCIQKGYPCSICVVPTNENLNNGDFNAMINFSLEKKIRVNVNLPAPAGKLLNDVSCLLTKESLDTLFKKYLVLENVLPDFKMATFSGEFVCPMGGDVIYILPDGNVCPCTFTQVAFGNVLKEPVGDILNKMHNSDLLKNLNRKRCCPISMDRDFISRVEEIKKKPLS